MWKASIGKETKNGSNGGGGDDWDTDADFVNDVNEKESRWGAKTVVGSGHQESVNVNSLRQQALDSDRELKKRQLEIMPKPSLGYGGKFGVQKDRMDKVKIFLEIFSLALSRKFLKILFGLAHI